MILYSFIFFNFSFNHNSSKLPSSLCLSILLSPGTRIFRSTLNCIHKTRFHAILIPDNCIRSPKLKFSVQTFLIMCFYLEILVAVKIKPIIDSISSLIIVTIVWINFITPPWNLPHFFCLFTEKFWYMSRQKMQNMLFLYIFY